MTDNSQAMSTEYQNTLKEVYETAVNRPIGHEWEYNDYTFIKTNAISDIASSQHSVVRLMNPDGNKVEMYVVDNFDDWESFAETVLELVEYDPDDLNDWLNRDWEQ